MVLFETRVDIENLDADSISVTRDSNDRITQIQTTYTTITVTQDVTWIGSDPVLDTFTRSVSEN